MELRPYQREAVTEVHREWSEDDPWPGNGYG